MLNTQRYLLYSGLFLITLTIVGSIGFGPTASASLAGQYFYLDSGENILHLAFGLLSLLGLWRLRSDKSLRIMSGLFGVVGLVAVVLAALNYNLPVPNLGIVHFEIADTVLHALLALWALWVAFMPEGPMFVREAAQASSTTTPAVS